MLIGACLAGCLAGCGASARPRVVRVQVSPAASVEDQPIRITVSGLPPHAVVSLHLASTDATGVRWVSTARLSATAAGTVDLNRSASLSGAYSGVWAMGLLTMMQPVSRDPVGLYYWAGNRPMRFALTVRAGHKTIGSATFMRRFSTTPLTIRSESLREEGFLGRFVYPSDARRRPAIVVLGGSEGGVPGPLASDPFAAHGYAVLALGYFKLPGLPQQLLRVPLEYFARALEWLRRQPQVDPTRVAVLGVSRGSEAALLSGAYFPHLVNAVIALSPSDAAVCSFPGCIGPAWTVHAAAVPFTRQFGNPHPSDQPNAVIPVQRIHGPVFTACGTDDAIWPSCGYARAIMSHLNAAHDPYPHTLFAYTGAGHSVASVIPYEPTDPGLFSDQHPQADEQAVASDWPKLLRFLATWRRSA